MRLYSLFQVEAQQLQKEKRSAALEQLPRHTADLAWVFKSVFHRATL